MSSEIAAVYCNVMIDFIHHGSLFNLSFFNSSTDFFLCETKVGYNPVTKIPDPSVNPIMPIVSKDKLLQPTM